MHANLRLLALAATFLAAWSLAWPTPLKASDNLGAKAVAGFLDNCIVGQNTFDAAASNFKRSGWRKASAADEASIGRILAIARNALKDAGRMEVYAAGKGANRLIAVVSMISPQIKGIGCYVYAVGGDFASAEAALEARIKTTASKKRVVEGAYRQREWRTAPGFHGHVSVKYAYAYPGGQLQAQLGINGVLLATNLLCEAVAKMHSFVAASRTMSLSLFACEKSRVNCSTRPIRATQNTAGCRLIGHARASRILEARQWLI